MPKTLKAVKNEQDIAYPVEMRDYLPLTDEQAEQVRGILDDEADEILKNDGRRQTVNAIKDAMRLAAFRVIQWHNEAPDEADNIRRLGVLRFVRTYRQARVWATLAGLKNNGIESLPL